MIFSVLRFREATRSAPTANNGKVVPFPPLPRPSLPLPPSGQWGDKAAAPLADRADDELMLLVRAGHTNALAVLARRHTPRLSAFCAKFLGDKRAAEDVVQDTWMSIWSGRETYRVEGKFVMLLYTAARNRCRNQRRSMNRRRRWFPETAKVDDVIGIVAADDPSHLDDLLRREREDELRLALVQVPEMMREALLLRFVEHLSYDDIAVIVGSNPSTVRSRVHHGVKQLRSLVGPGGLS